MKVRDGRLGSNGGGQGEREEGKTVDFGLIFCAL